MSRTNAANCDSLALTVKVALIDLNFKSPEAQVYTFMLSLSFLRTQSRCPQTAQQEQRVNEKVLSKRRRDGKDCNGVGDLGLKIIDGILFTNPANRWWVDP